MWNVLTVPTVWYFNCPRQCAMSTTMLNVLTVPTVLYFNCPRHCGMFLLFDSVVFNRPRQCGIFLLFRQCGILTVPDNVECSYCSDSVEF